MQAKHPRPYKTWGELPSRAVTITSGTHFCQYEVRDRALHWFDHYYALTTGVKR